MAEQELSLLISLRDQVTDQLRSMNAEIKANTKEWQENFSAVKGQAQQTGIALAAFGAAITGTFVMAYKASEEDRLANARLSTSLKNIGVDYDSVKVSIDQFTEATLKSTAVGKSEQIDALNQLVMTTGDYNQALKILPIALDLAAAKQMDVQTAALLLGRVAEGNVNALNRYGFSMDGVKTSGEALNVIQSKVTGSAQAMLSPFQLLKTQLDELGSDIGDLVAGTFGDLITSVADIVAGMRGGVEKNPETASMIADIALALGVATLATGALAMAAVGLAAALALLGGPVTLVLLGIGYIIFGVVLLLLWWKKLEDGTLSTWQQIVLGVVLATNSIAMILFVLMKAISIVNEYWDSAQGFWANIWNLFKLAVMYAVNGILTLLELLVNAGAWLIEVFVNNVIIGPILGAVNLVLAGVEAMVNGVIWLLNKIPGVDLKSIEMPDLKWNLDIPTLKIPRLTEDLMGIFKPGPEWDPTRSHLKGGLDAPAVPDILGGFGRYGGLGQTVITDSGNVTIEVQGSVISDQDLMNLIRQELLKLQTRVPTTGIR